MRTPLLVFGLVSLAACTQNGDAKDFYDRTQQGTDWQLTIRDGKHTDAAYGPDYYMGACPAFAARTIHVPAADDPACEPGCTCSFAFSLSDDGDVGHRYNLDAGFYEQCDDGSSIECIAPNPETGEVGWCTWLAGTIDPAVDPFGDCTYTFDLVEIGG